MAEIYDVIIIGGGPAGLTAALYNARARLKTLVLEKTKLGGQIALTHEIANFPGAVKGAGEEPSGAELIARMTEQAQRFGAEIIIGKEVTDLLLEGSLKRVSCSDGTIFQTRSIICANGAVPREIGCPGEIEFKGKGVSYCATCDGAFFEELEVYVVGGGNSAVEEALFLTSFARKVTLIQNLDKLTASAIAIEQAKANDKIHYMYHTVVEAISGDGLVEAMTLRNTETNETFVVEADDEDGTFGIFVFIGYVPTTALYEGMLDLTDQGYIVTNDLLETSISGVFVAGDIRPKLLRQVITASGDGATAAFSAQRYLETNELN
ncbi:NAD(P)/FAD-dependent oxidoreductase [Vagococcus intermedius]|uniref:FAD-dependent oxidoreductase n=1 Tax=Vagococcus intermedius TaxID=2991418 RepID=A0AAF0CWC6_9ENTE|nr:FAD-dependent oxidoreductase [Vagococcus intermedius]WEG74078.1 FAD-dependent oxidoreductase [Vagococcus intermedius]WEG76158.1 FAD-dependent oxidoreductase [Vagococcus intermedius]